MSSLLVLMAVVGCKSPLEAPSDLEELSRWMFEEWEDPDALAAGAANLLAYSDDVDFEADWEGRSYEGGALSAGVVDGLVSHNYHTEDTNSVMLFYASRYDATDHQNHIVMEDQLEVEPSSSELYNRSFIEGDAECFLDGSCDLVRSMNNVRRDNALYTIDYDMRKDWRWVEIEDVGTALCARSFNLESASANLIDLWQGYSVDIFLPGDDGAIRFQSTWQELEMAGLDAEDVSKTIVKGIDDGMAVQDEWLDEN